MAIRGYWKVPGRGGVVAGLVSVAGALGHDLVGSFLAALALDQPDIGGTMEAEAFHEISEWSCKDKSVAHYRAAAERARKLLKEVTTPRLKQYLAEVIAYCESSAAEDGQSITASN
jgi:hypothetical protein